jgi:predicted HNH restriction endonuclease
VPPQVIDDCIVKDGQRRNVTFKTQKGEQFTLDASITSGCEISLPKKYQNIVRGNDYVEISIVDELLVDSTNNITLPDIDQEFLEGRSVLRKHLLKERNRKLIELAKTTRLATEDELRCDVCNISFKERYGEIGKDFIEAHHVVPLSGLNSSTRMRIEDLALLCSNCHRMIHRGNPILTLEQLKHKLR